MEKKQKKLKLEEKKKDDTLFPDMEKKQKKLKLEEKKKEDTLFPDMEKKQKKLKLEEKKKDDTLFPDMEKKQKKLKLEEKKKDDTLFPDMEKKQKKLKLEEKKKDDTLFPDMEKKQKKLKLEEKKKDDTLFPDMEKKQKKLKLEEKKTDDTLFPDMEKKQKKLKLEEKKKDDTKSCLWGKLETIVEEEEFEADDSRVEKESAHHELTQAEKDVIPSLLSPRVSPSEEKFREMYPDVKDILKENIKCTSCLRSVKRLVTKGEPLIHPFLETLICKKCHIFYGNGEFSADEDGTDKYCRWCGQGGTLYLCNLCPRAFCKLCVKRNVPKSLFTKIKGDGEWICFKCNAAPVYQLRAQCWAAQQYAAEYVKKEEQVPMTSSQRHFMSCNSDSNQTEESLLNKKKQKEELEEKNYKKRRNGDENDSNEGRPSKRIDDSRLKIDSENESNGQLEYSDRTVSSAVCVNSIYAIVNKITSVVTDIAGMTKETHEKLVECNKNKINSENLNSTESVIEMCNKLNSMLVAHESNVQIARKGLKEYVEQWCKVVNEDLNVKGTKKDETGENKFEALELNKKGENKSYPQSEKAEDRPTQEQHTRIRKSPNTFSEGGFASQSTTCAGMQNDSEIDFENVEELSFLDQFLLPTADITFDEAIQEMTDPFGVFEEYDEQWVAPPEIPCDPYYPAGVPENRREGNLFSLTAKQMEGTSEKISWPNSSHLYDINVDSSGADTSLEFLNRNNTNIDNSIPSCSEETTTAEDKWLNLADVAEQIGK